MADLYISSACIRVFATSMGFNIEEAIALEIPPESQSRNTMNERTIRRLRTKFSRVEPTPPKVKTSVLLPLTMKYRRSITRAIDKLVRLRTREHKIFESARFNF